MPLISLERPFDIDEFSQMLGETTIRSRSRGRTLPRRCVASPTSWGSGSTCTPFGSAPAPEELLKRFVIELRRVDFSAERRDWIDVRGERSLREPVRSDRRPPLVGAVPKYTPAVGPAREWMSLATSGGSDRILAELGQLRQELAELRREQQELAQAVSELTRTFKGLAIQLGVAADPYQKGAERVEGPGDPRIRLIAVNLAPTSPTS